MELLLQLLANKLSKVSLMIKSSKVILSPYMIQNVYFTKFQAPLVWDTILGGGGGGVDMG
jgi:hypothetical protein